MTTNQVVVGGNYCHWRAKTNTNKNEFLRPGFASPWLVVVIIFVFSGIYLYFTNSSAGKGYEMRQVEKDISELKKESEQLRIKEAELKSLYHIEESSREFNMADANKISYIEEKSPVAMK